MLQNISFPILPFTKDIFGNNFTTIDKNSINNMKVLYILYCRNNFIIVDKKCEQFKR